MGVLHTFEQYTVVGTLPIFGQVFSLLRQQFRLAHSASHCVFLPGTRYFQPDRAEPLLPKRNGNGPQDILPTHLKPYGNGGNVLKLPHR